MTTFLDKKKKVDSTTSTSELSTTNPNLETKAYLIILDLIAGEASSELVGDTLTKKGGFKGLPKSLS